MKRSTLSLFFLVAALATGMAQAQVLAPSNHGPVAFNAWAGIGYDRLQAGVSTGGFSFTGGPADRAAVSLGGDLGVQLTPGVALVALGEWEPIFGDQNGSNADFTVGGGVRFGQVASSGINGLVGAGYSRFVGDSSGTDGFAIKGLLFAPIAFGFGPFLELSFHHYSATALGITGDLSLFSAHAGVSYSY